MIDFDFEIKTKLFFGKGKENEVGNILGSFSAQRVLIIIGQGSVKRSGLLDAVISKLKESKIDYQLLEGVRPNPTINLVRQFIEVARDYKPDFLLAVGGGSVIDTAKLVSVGYYYGGDPFDFNLHIAKPEKNLPLGVILTISAAGSEMSTSCVIQDDQTSIKRGFNSELVRPFFAIENPELTFDVSPAQTTYGIVDIMMHTMERYFQPSSDNEPADRFAEGLLKSVIEAAKVVINNPRDYESRAVLMLMSSLSHNGLTSIGKKAFMPVHQLEHALSGVYPNVAHGAGLSVLFLAWAKMYVNYDTAKFDQFARNVFDSHIDDESMNAKAGIKALEDFYKLIKAPISFEDLGIENPDIDKLVDVLLDGGKKTISHNKQPIDIKIARIIYESCFRRKQK